MQVFQFLLTVNRAKWSLETVHMKQVDVTRLSPMLQRRVRLLLLLRARLLHFVNNLINYLMTRVCVCVHVHVYLYACVGVCACSCVCAQACLCVCVLCVCVCGCVISPSHPPDPAQCGGGV